MQEMTSYLNNYREEEPEWIEKYLRGEQHHLTCTE
jgi:hypothetical protein